jgi:hypothetical protein
MNIEAIRYSKTLVDIYQITWHHIPKDSYQLTGYGLICIETQSHDPVKYIKRPYVHY